MLDNFKTYLEKNPTLSAPLSGITDRVQRKVQRAFGAGLLFTWLISARGLKYSFKSFRDSIKFYDEEHPIGIQLFGYDIDELLYASKLCENLGFDFIDFNFGCPSISVTRHNAGGALLKDVSHIKNILDKIKNNISLPITIKIRSSWDNSNYVYPEIGKIAEEYGISMITLHPRAVSEHKKGRANWEHIKILKSSINIPVIGNGDVKSFDDALRMKNETNCDGIMIGRGSIGSPWIFTMSNAILNDNKIPTIIESILYAFNILNIPYDKDMNKEPEIYSIFLLAKYHIEMLKNEYGDDGIKFARAQIPHYLTSFPYARELRNNMFQAKSIDDMNQILINALDILRKNRWQFESLSV